ncbi:MAG: helix-turn-helix domain-containing protein [Burkholderiaceae bacterium]|nr:helix-turn-helix domain-containing protein [Burkholderiaceae bacterium]
MPAAGPSPASLLPAAATPRCWTTDDAPPGQRLGYWTEAVCEGFLEMEVDSRQAASFHSRLESAPLGDIVVNRVLGSGQDVWRTRRAIHRGRGDEVFYLLGHRSAAWRCAQAGRQALLQPGDLVLVDARRCYEFHFEQHTDVVSLELPRPWLERWLAAPERQLAQRLASGSGWGRALAAFAWQLTPALACAAPLPALQLSDQLGGLLALACGESAPAPQADEDGVAGASLVQRAAAAIRQRHAEPGLGAADLAAGLGVSERSLHRHLAASGQGFAQRLAAERMAAAQRLLDQPRFDRLGVAEIGRRVGLLDASHFVRLFRRHLGQTPAARRRQR